ncbi:hypothetical protein HELRODRAFT_74919, partial [Helobdella robusta]|uniref:Large ribosomal subunit protein uL16m n=1 Tax=Helobdella robusta TaxID=6412 RepID=T1G1X8_HELRO
IEFPEKRKLKFVEKTPHPLFGIKIRKMPKQLIDIRGPEDTLTYLLHKQYGIRALQGGQLRFGHFEMMRSGINRKMNESRCFALWRIDNPWKPITKKGQGHRMGGGKGNIDHYVTPVKAGRIILEFGGKIGFEEAYPILKRVAAKLPFKADVVSQEILEKEKLGAEALRENNLNPFSFEYCLKNNIMGCKQWASPYDFLWFGKYR